MPLIKYSKSNKQNAEKLIFVIGGGSAIDEAKIMAKKEKKILIAIPTTGSGASETSHAVVWGKTKRNVKTDKPISIPPPFEIKLPKQVRRESTFDILGHIVDYLNVCSDNELIELGMYAGRLIEKHPTNLTHPRSYPLTLKYGLPHGEAVGVVLCDCIREAFLPLNKNYFLPFPHKNFPKIEIQIDKSLPKEIKERLLRIKKYAYKKPYEFKK
jgi:alcohol dehydrogenase class IV